MSNKIIVLWGFIIVSLVCTIYFIGVKYQSEIKYINLKEEVKESTKKYIEDNDIKLPLKITSEELESKGYIGELRLDNKICACDINVKKQFLFYSFDLDFECIKVEE